MKIKELSLICGNTTKGREAFNEVLLLALRTRIKLNSIAQKAIGAEDSVIELLKEESDRVVTDFNSLRFEILKGVSETAVEVGNQVTLDEFCNSVA